MKLTNIELEELQFYMKDKTIALIGNGARLLNKSDGNEIDSHDVVIRINGGAPFCEIEKYKKILGKKHDIYPV